ncbi:unnamed protein product [Gordionus sp. m RMFG-2023]
MYTSLLNILMLLLNTEAKIPDKKEIKSILNTHNKYRAYVNPASSAMFKLRWSSEGAIKAQAMTKRCIFNHSSLDRDRAISKYSEGGQNLFLSRGTFVWNWNDIIKSWHDEVSDFTFGVHRNTTTGHYTQVVWGTTQEVGCAMTQCNADKIYACNYYPSGNIKPTYLPYIKSNVQSCKGCIKGRECSKDVYAGKLLEKCALFGKRVQQFSNANR